MLAFVKHGRSILVLYDHNPHYDVKHYEEGWMKNVLLNDIDTLYMGNDGLYKFWDDYDPYEVTPLTIHDLLTYPAIIYKLYELHYANRDYRKYGVEAKYEYEEPVCWSHYALNNIDDDKHMLRFIINKYNKEKLEKKGF